MHIEESGIDRRVPIVGPGQVHQVRSGEVDDLFEVSGRLITKLGQLTLNPIP